MATEKYQTSEHHDNPNHDGYKANRQRLEAAIAQSDMGNQIIWSMALVRQLNRLPEEAAEFHKSILKSWGLL